MWIKFTIMVKEFVFKNEEITYYCINAFPNSCFSPIYHPCWVLIWVVFVTHQSVTNNLWVVWFTIVYSFLSFSITFEFSVLCIIFTLKNIFNWTMKATYSPTVVISKSSRTKFLLFSLKYNKGWFWNFLSMLV